MKLFGSQTCMQKNLIDVSRQQKTSNQSPSKIELTTDALHDVFTRLDASSLARCRAVSKTWQCVASSPQLRPKSLCDLPEKLSVGESRLTFDLRSLPEDLRGFIA